MKNKCEKSRKSCIESASMHAPYIIVRTVYTVACRYIGNKLT